MVEVARVVDDERTITDAELMTETEAALVVHCGTKTGGIEFDLEGRLVDARQGKQNIRKNEECCGGRRRRGLRM